MGAKILSQFPNGSPGAISRSIDDVVVALPNRGSGAIKFGDPVFLNNDPAGTVRGFASGDTAAAFAGIAVRNPSKTPSTYGSNLAQYEQGDVTDVLVRGSIIVKLASNTASPAIGGKVYLVATGDKAGQFTATATDNIELPNARFKNSWDLPNCVEVVLTGRNTI